ncbi:MAG: peptide chain release factor 2 [Planctomycetota bacterium]
MMVFAELRARLSALKERLIRLRDSLDYETKRRRLEVIEGEMGLSSFWDDPEARDRLLEELKSLRPIVEPMRKLLAKLEDALVLEELIREAGEASEEAGELASWIDALERDSEQFSLELMLGGPHDRRSAYLSIQAGSGGTESCDWARMLVRLYLRWCERHGYVVEEVDRVDDPESGGVKSTTLHVAGDNAYGYLRAEAGVHRLVRISPFDAQKRRHTSFASVDVIPEFDEDVAVEIELSDLKVDTFRAGGAGGQHVNKTDSAVRITHLPSGIVVQCQNERSQHKNRSTAMKMLKAKLYAREEEKRRAELRDLSGEKSEIAWGHQIRSYVFQPYTLVKDHRTGVEVGNVGAVMDGEIDEFIRTYLSAQQGGTRHAGSKRPPQRE